MARSSLWSRECLPARTRAEKLEWKEPQTSFDQTCWALPLSSPQS